MLSQKKKRKEEVLLPKDAKPINNDNDKWLVFYKEKFGSPIQMSRKNHLRTTHNIKNKSFHQRQSELATLLPNREKGASNKSNPNEQQKTTCNMKGSDSSIVLPLAYKRIPSYEEEQRKSPVRVLGGAGEGNRDRKPTIGRSNKSKKLEKDSKNAYACHRSNVTTKDVDNNYYQSSKAYGSGDPGVAKDLTSAGRPSRSSTTTGSIASRDLYKRVESLPSYQAELFRPPQGRRKSATGTTIATPIPYSDGCNIYEKIPPNASSSSKVWKPDCSSNDFGYTNSNEGRQVGPPVLEESSSENSAESLNIAESSSSQHNRILTNEQRKNETSSRSSSKSISPLTLNAKMSNMKLLNHDQQEEEPRQPLGNSDYPSKSSSNSNRRLSYSNNSFSQVGSNSLGIMQKDSRGNNRSSQYTGTGVPGLVGLVNEGNTCYLNSCLQCLAHSMPLASAVQGPIESLVKRRESGTRAGMSQPDFSSLAEVLAYAFKEVVRDLWERPAFTATSARVFLQCVQAWAPQFAGHSQHDAQEVLRAILDGLHEALNRVSTAPPYRDLYLEPKPEDELAELTWRYHKLCQDSIIQDIFCGQLQSTIECCTCHRKSHCFDPFHDLSLPLPRESNSRHSLRGGNSRSRVTLHDCLLAFVAPEQLEGSNKYYCSGCKAPRTSMKKLTLYRLPPILVLHIKRFYKSERFSYQKDDTPVYYPLEGLDFTDFLSTRARNIRRGGVVYDLHSVCCHMGSLGCGHYIAQCKNCENNAWYCFNDSSVTPMQEATIISSSAYILFYQQRS